MSERSDLDLFVEIVKLLRRFGPEAFERLAGSLDGAVLTTDLASVLLRTARHGRMIRSASKARSEGGFRSRLVELEKTEAGKSELLLKLYDSLVGKRALPTLRDIVTFASDAGLPLPKGDSRSKAIIPLIKSLSALTADDIRARCASIRFADTASDRSLESWSSVILDRTRRKDSHS